MENATYVVKHLTKFLITVIEYFIQCRELLQLLFVLVANKILCSSGRNTTTQFISSWHSFFKSN